MWNCDVEGTISTHMVAERLQAQSPEGQDCQGAVWGQGRVPRPQDTPHRGHGNNQVFYYSQQITCLSWSFMMIHFDWSLEILSQFRNCLWYHCAMNGRELQGETWWVGRPTDRHGLLFTNWLEKPVLKRVRRLLCYVSQSHFIRTNIFCSQKSSPKGTLTILSLLLLV